MASRRYFDASIPVIESLWRLIPDDPDRIPLLSNAFLAGENHVRDGVDLAYQLHMIMISYALRSLLTKGLGYVKEV